VSYSEENGEVVLRMSREDYEELDGAVGLAVAWAMTPERIWKMWDRLNSGNPNYTPYQVETKKP
jgi:hypothetical protein